MASFENLVVLANYEEHLREARRVVWRDRGEKPVELQDLGECVEHACRGGIRASLSSSFSSVAVARGPAIARLIPVLCPCFLVT